MPRGGATSGTRRGNGAGYGGEAKGAGAKPGSGQGGRPPGVKNGEGKVAKAREALIEAAPLAVQVVLDTMRRQGAGADADARTALQAAQSVLNKVGLHDKSGVELGGADGGPIVVVTGVPRADAD